MNSVGSAPTFRDAAGVPKPHLDLEALTAPGAPPFAMLRRQGAADGEVDILVGDIVEVKSVEELPVTSHSSAVGAHNLLVVVPYRQIAERGFDCVDDGAPMLVLRVHRQTTITVAEALQQLPAEAVTLVDGSFDVDEEAYADTVRTVLADEIGMGAGANFVIKRSFKANVVEYSARTALALFARLLTIETGAYWTFVVYTGARTFVGASPERHVSLSAGEVTMNPISGTYRYPPTGPTLQGLLNFLSDRKERDELYMVLDEELKMMARICSGGGRVIGPQLREMARLAHTEYLLRGESHLDCKEILLETLFAPTVTGSPLESACRVIHRYEPGGRGYYSGVLALIGHGEAGHPAMDSTILIRTAEISGNGQLRISAGATLVRHSDPDSEAAETRTKLEGLLSAFGDGGRRDTSSINRPSESNQSGCTHTLSRDATDSVDPRELVCLANTTSVGLAQHPLVRLALDRRNENLARFWLERNGEIAAAAPELVGRTVLVIDAEDTFTAMLRLQLASLGMVVTVRRLGDAPEPGDYDFVVLGPGPGDPRALHNPKIASLRAIATTLLEARRPFIAVCLGHQVLSSVLGLRLTRKSAPNQGAQFTINYYGVRKTVGFYNTFVALSDGDRLYSPHAPDGVEICRDDHSGEVHALRGHSFYSTQFHPESVLSPDGLGVLRDMLESLQRRAVGAQEPQEIGTQDWL